MTTHSHRSPSLAPGSPPGPDRGRTRDEPGRDRDASGGHRIVFGALVIAGSLAAFLAAPFTGLDTLPALGVVLLSLAVLLEDFAIVIAVLVVGVTGVVLEIVLGSADVMGVGNLL